MLRPALPPLPCPQPLSEALPRARSPCLGAGRKQLAAPSGFGGPGFHLSLSVPPRKAPLLATFTPGRGDSEPRHSDTGLGQDPQAETGARVHHQQTRLLRRLLWARLAPGRTLLPPPRPSASLASRLRIPRAAGASGWRPVLGTGRGGPEEAPNPTALWSP